MPVVSSVVYSTRDRAGNPRTEAWLTLEFTGAYQGDGAYGGGQSFDLSPYFKRIDYIVTAPMSGSTLRDLVSGASRQFLSGNHVQAVPVVEDFATPASARFQLWGHSVASSFLGFAQLASGAAAAISGIRFGARVMGG